MMIETSHLSHYVIGDDTRLRVLVRAGTKGTVGSNIRERELVDERNRNSAESSSHRRHIFLPVRWTQTLDSLRLNCAQHLIHK